MGVSSCGTPVAATATPSASMSQQGTWPTGSSPLNNHLIVAIVCLSGTSTSTLGGTPAGYTLLTSINNSGPQCGVYTKTATGSDTAPTFTGTTTGTAGDSMLAVVIYDLQDSSGLPPVADVTGTITGTTAAIATAATTTPNSGDLAGPSEFTIGAGVQGNGTTAATYAWTAPGGWTPGPNVVANQQGHYAVYHRPNLWPFPGSTISINIDHSTGASTEEVAVITVFAPPVTSSRNYPFPIFSVEIATNTTSYVTTLLATVAAVQVGDMIIVAANNASTLADGATSCTDSGGNTYTLVKQDTSGVGAYNTTMFICAKATAALTPGTSTVTVSYSSGIAEVKNIAGMVIPGDMQPVLDTTVEVTTSSASTASLALASGTMAGSRELLVAAFSGTASATGYATWSNAWLPITPQYATTNYLALAIMWPGTQASHTATVTQAVAGACGMVMVGIKTTPLNPAVEPGGQDALTGNIVSMGQAIAAASQW